MISSSNFQSIQSQSVENQIKQLINWINYELFKKNIPQINSLYQLVSGNIFIQIINIYYPKKIQLSKTFMKPKDDYQILQNYKQILAAFNKLGWKKFDPEKFRKKKQKDLINLAQFLKRTLSEHIIFDQNNLSSNKKNSFITMNKESSPNKMSNIKINSDKKNSVIKNEVKNFKIQKKNSQIIDREHANTQKQIYTNSSSQWYTQNSSSKNTKPPFNPTKSNKIILNQSNKLSLSPQKNDFFNKQSNLQEIQIKQDQYQTFQNVKISKLQKQKSNLLKAIMKIQKLIIMEKRQENLKKNYIDSQKINADCLNEQEKILKLQNKLLKIIDQVI